MPFDVKTVDLEGSNLIEASAGTGKTYSIAILVLRLILEKNISIDKILMVTFTKTAVAELETRIRKFVRKAYQFSSGIDIDDKTIKGVVGDVRKDKKKKLQKAVQLLDSLSVMTIHGFCQQIIEQNPFETNQSFEAELMTDSENLIMYFVNDYWRSELNTIKDLELFKYLNDNITRSKIKAVIAKSLDDKQFICEAIDIAEVLREIKTLLSEIESSKLNFTNQIMENWAELLNRNFNRYARSFIESYNQPLLFVSEIINKAAEPKDYVSKYFSEELEIATLILKKKSSLKESIAKYIYFVYSELIEKLKNNIIENKVSKDIITYNDLIRDVQTAVQNNTVNQVLLKQFDAVFIDEFQDTNKKQYEIFGPLFNETKIIFYIGDPKQSIYGFQKADILTYKGAKQEVDRLHSMNYNFRSTPGLIAAMNAFFSIQNPFYDNEIEYVDVESAANNLGVMTENDIEVLPLAINTFKNNSEIIDFVKNEILRLLTDKSCQINGEPIKPEDIAVLVRKNSQTSLIKKSLSTVNIPAITVDDSSVLKSDEAQSLIYLLNALLNPGRSLINKVLLNDNFGFKRTDIERLDNEYHLEKFRILRKEWFDKGIYNTLTLFMAAYHVRNNCLQKGLAGQRALSNYMQLTEIMHEKTVLQKYTPEELLVWLTREKEKKLDEYEQRVESEEKAVQIATIHKAKGLTYKIVFAPFLDLNIKGDCDFFDFRDDEGYKFTANPNEEQLELYNQQNEQENRRLIYVALTRAQYKNYICTNKHHYYNRSSLKVFLNNQSEYFEVNREKKSEVNIYMPEINTRAFSPRDNPKIEIINTFGLHSFSSLSKAHFIAPFEKVELTGEENGYNQFIFQILGRGAKVGNALHSIFEHLDFTDEYSKLSTLAEASKYYPNIIKEKDLAMFEEMIDHIMNANLGDENSLFYLKEVADNKKLPELEFHFSINQVNKHLLNEVLGEQADLKGEADLEGLMTGFIDLFFEHEEKYYILDWKSNHLGNSIEDYSQEKLEEAMKGSNYNLQYHIYTIAVNRFLKSKIKDYNYDRHFGGVIYLFLRGIRSNQSSGVYFIRPSSENIQKLDELLLKQEV
jgi:exodeoxyribonuclease V beta subunit